ncbi:TadE/TadG family type IV pilus assembly protein [Kitasatospora sp. NPDC001175]|uniref:TadE/TadG family type IV pilus assembly protein n=1 Tax=Kitasatospora sp. NPDC001175 TaxID=3157103 RepID=UPI003D036573
MSISKAARRRWASDAGSVATELALVAPLLLALALLAVGLGRLAGARLDINDAAHQAARAASFARTLEEARASASRTASDALAHAGTSCPDPRTSTDTSGFRAGGQVTVTVSCDVALADLGAVPLPGQQTVTGRFTAPVDTYISDRP